MTPRPTSSASCVVVVPNRVLTVVSDDDDNRVLEAAIEGAADYIVSGDADLLDLAVIPSSGVSKTATTESVRPRPSCFRPHLLSRCRAAGASQRFR